MSEAVKISLGLDLDDFLPRTKTAEKALTGIGTAGQTSARQISAATRQLPAQFTDIATSLAGGRFMVLLQQGGQIKDSFGGIVGRRTRIVGAINPPPSPSAQPLPWPARWRRRFVVAMLRAKSCAPRWP